MNKVHDVLNMVIQNIELKKLIAKGDIPPNLTISDLVIQEDAVLTECKDLLQELDGNSLESCKQNLVSSLLKLIEDSNTVSKELVNLSKNELVEFGAPVGEVISSGDSLSVKLFKSLNPGTNLYTVQLSGPESIQELTIEDIRECVKLGDYETLMLPAIEKIINKFKLKNGLMR